MAFFSFVNEASNMMTLFERDKARGGPIFRTQAEHLCAAHRPFPSGSANFL